MSDPATVNDVIRAASPALDRLLSPLGRRAVFPADIPFQAAQARGKEMNATIGQITDGDGRPLPLEPLADGLRGLPEGLRDRGLLYSSVEGIPELRRAWRQWQRRLAPEGAAPVSLPLVTVGLTHGLSLVADLFGGEGRPVVVPWPCWGNYRQVFQLRTGAELLEVRGFDGEGYRCEAVEEVLAERPEQEPALAVLNLPSNPGGYSLDRAERRRVRESLVRAAHHRPLLVLCDDAYAGLVYEEEIPRASIFWELVGSHPNLVPVKVDGVTKELSFFGGRVGFLTFPFEPESSVAEALESKVKCLLRGTLGSPVAVSQALSLRALGSPGIEGEVERIRTVLDRRYRTLKEALATVPPGLFRSLPFNSGCFALLELREELGITAEQARLHLLENRSTGLVAIAPRFLRIAFCSVRESSVPDLVARIVSGVEELAGRSGA
ncbi:MAG: aminotransferase class I/II-fold pyridoxal phosphate-dependent enzyme [Thermoanaerobaculia bacterium]|nr:aminotransferase class I/II-fold pyridoxal phosphate-dependent enzyme [Thermoanaerobaculia bacterium]